MYDAISIPVQFNLIRTMHGNSYNVYNTLDVENRDQSVRLFCLHCIKNQFWVLENWCSLDWIVSERRLFTILWWIIIMRINIKISEKRKIENSVARFTKPDKLSNHIWIIRKLWNFGKAIQHPLRISQEI